MRNLLAANPDALAVCLDQCYAASAPVARAYFQARCVLLMTLSTSRSIMATEQRVRQVLAEVYVAQPELAVPAHVLVSLVLYKVVDEDAARPPPLFCSLCCHAARSCSAEASIDARHISTDRRCARMRCSC